MDFMNRGQQSNGGRPNTVFSAGAPHEPQQPAEHHAKPERSNRLPLASSDNKFFRWGGSTLVILVALLIAGALALFFTYKPASEASLVDSGKLQAVFLTNDQVYFGNVTKINDDFLVMNNIYYLQTSNGSANKSTASNISLVKLGCELHKPQDQMVISQRQVSFWENLQSDGQVAKAVKSYQEANPNGQTCNNSTQTTNPVQGSTESQTNATPNTTPTTTPTTQTTPKTKTPATKP